MDPRSKAPPNAYTQKGRDRMKIVIVIFVFINVLRVSHMGMVLFILQRTSICSTLLHALRL